MSLLSLVVPCFNEQESIPLFYKEIISIAQQMDYVDFEFLFIDDGSKDNTINILKELSGKDSRVSYISFSRNFGKEAAIYAGLKNASGDYVALIDADLQHPPKLLIEMYDAIVNQGYDCAGAKRFARKKEPFIRKAFSNLFFKLLSKLSKSEMEQGTTDYRLMTRQMVNSILSMSEYNRFTKGIFNWVGYKTKWIEYQDTERVAGETKWSFFKLFLYSLEGIIGFSTAPLAIASIIGIVFFFFALIMMCVIVIKTLIWGEPVAGFPTLMCSIFLIGGIQLFCMGILGQYLAKTYLETKKRPIYISKEQKLYSANDIEINQ